MRTKNKGAWLVLAATLLLSVSSAAIAAPAGMQVTPFRDGKLFKGNVSYHVSRAENALINGSYQKAETSFRSAIAKNPRDYRARAGLGLALAMQFKLDGAEDQVDRALKLSPKDALAHTAKAMVLMNRLQSSSGTVMRNRQSILSQAEQHAREAINSDPNMPEARFMMGSIYKEEGRLADASREFEKACDLDPHYSSAQSALGLSYLAQGKLDDASNSFKHAIAIKSKNSTAHYGLGKVYLQRGQADAALKELNTALYLNRNSAPVQIALGDTYTAQGNTVGALKSYQEAIRIKPESPDAYMRIADIRESRVDLEHAIAELHSGLAMNPDSIELHNRVGDMSLKLEKLDDAIKEYRATLAVDPGNIQAVDGLTTGLYLKTQKEGQGAFFVSDDYESAQQNIKEAITLAPNNMMLRLADARLRALSGQEIDLKAIGEPRNDGERVAYAEALMSQNRFDEASQQFGALIVNAQNAKQTFAVADLALMLKDLNSAQLAYAKAKTFPGYEERAKRGMAKIAKVKEESRQHLTMAKDFYKKGQYNSSVDQYRAAIYNNPKDAAARLELAEAIQKTHPNADLMRDVANQYRAYLALSPTLEQKEQEKFKKKIASAESKASKIEHRAIARQR